MAETRPSLLITGASGFLGDRLLKRLPLKDFSNIRCLGRTVSATMRSLAGQRVLTCFGADLRKLPALDAALSGVDTVMHLAARTGKASPKDYFAINTFGTRELLAQCARCGVRNFVFVSTVAARFAEVSGYYYAQSKRAAEASVAASGLKYTIVRPTIIVGHGGGAWEGLARLARLPVTPVFGNGQAPIQPVYVDDLADVLLTIVREELFANETVEVGGPERIPIGEFLRRIRRAHGGSEKRLVYLPLKPSCRVIGYLEGWLRPVLPVTAGQLRTFGEDGTARPNPLFQRCAPRMKGIEEMIALCVGNGKGSCNGCA